jgi:molecular chaperone GrpE
MNGQPDGPEAGTDEAGQQQPPASDEVEEVIDAEERLAALQQQVDENWDRYLRAAAEVENVRKRAIRDVENARKFALENFSKDLLVVKDSLEMGLEAAENTDAANLQEGSEATLRQLTATLERHGVVEVDPHGEPFDPELHEAMTMQPSETAEPGSVLTVVQKGYVLSGRLLRPARVIVAAEPVEPAEPIEEPADE